MAVVRKLNMAGVPAMPPGTPEHHCTAVITEEPPLAYRAALWAVAGCAAGTARLLWRRRLHLPRGHGGMTASAMCTGSRIVRAWPAIARVMAGRIHQVAYVENL